MRVVIFGSGGLAKELIGYLATDPIRYEIAYVVSTESFNNLAFRFQVREKVDPSTDAGYLLAVADPGIKRKIVGENPDQWMTYIHPSCYISPYAKIGRGSIFAPQAIVGGDPVIGQFCFFNTNAAIGHDSKLGDYSTLFPNTEIGGDCDLGEDCLLGIGAYVIPGITLPRGTKVSAGAVVRESLTEPGTIYGDPRGAYRVRTNGNSA